MIGIEIGTKTEIGIGPEIGMVTETVDTHGGTDRTWHEIARKPEKRVLKRRGEEWLEESVEGGFVGKELEHGVDDFCDSIDHVGAGAGYFVHDGWVHSHPTGHCRGDASDQSDSGAKGLITVLAL
jgi:hypothetical protein